MDKTHILSRISRDGTKAIVREGDSFRTMDLSTKEYASDPNSLGALIASGTWRRPTEGEKSSFAVEEPVVTEEEAAEIFSSEQEIPGTYEFNPDYDFFATPYEGADDGVDGVYAIEPETGDLYFWDNGEFTLVDGQSLDPSIPEQWILVDSDTAQYIAQWKDNCPDGETSVLIYGNNPDEKAMFDAAEAEIDWDFMATLSAVVADASGYSPVERSRNASRQRRGPGGRFARHSGDEKPVAEKDVVSNSEILKTYIPATRDLKLLNNPLNFIVDFITAASPSSGPSIGGGVAVAASGDLPKISEEAQKETREETVSSPDTAYFAIVHAKDNKAVQNLIAITKSESGAPQAWNRNNGEWKISPDLLADLQSVTPPPVVQLDEETVKVVMKGVDEYDAKQGDAEPEEVQASGMTDIVRKGYAMSDGSFIIRNSNDLTAAIRLAPEDASFELKNHIVKRARALNRMDIVPTEWRSLAVISDQPLFDSYGEVIIAAGKGNRGNAETLREYWLNGPGSKKIGWTNSEGDLTRCNRLLSRYMPGRSFGYCQMLHMRKFGKSNYKRDNG